MGGAHLQQPKTQVVRAATAKDGAHGTDAARMLRQRTCERRRQQRQPAGRAAPVRLPSSSVFPRGACSTEQDMALGLSLVGRHNESPAALLVTARPRPSIPSPRPRRSRTRSRQDVAAWGQGLSMETSPRERQMTDSLITSHACNTSVWQLPPCMPGHTPNQVVI